MAKTVRASNQGWTLLEKIGSGDAGEVWRVEAETNKQTAVLKRPVQNVSGGTILRQATQIEAEGKILKILDGINSSRNNIRIHTPTLIDQSVEGTSGTTGLFIVSEEVSGVSITKLLDRLHLGQSAFSQVLTLKVLAASFHLLRKVHARGILWNDVKMDHIFWNEESNLMSFIDWGNGLMFDPDSPDERIHPKLDFQQLIDEGSLLLSQISPDLIQDLDWPLSAKALSDLDIFHLQMRVEYLENHLGMRVSEYQILFSRYLQSADDINGMKSVFDLKKALENLGVEVDSAPILHCAGNIWNHFLENGDEASAKEFVQLLEDHLVLPPEWQLMVYFYKSLNQAQRKKLPGLFRCMLENDWSNAMWTFQSDFHSFFSEENKTNVLLSMRKLANNLKDMPTIIPQVLPTIQGDLRQNIQRLNKSHALDPATLSQLNGFDHTLAQILTSWSVLSEKEPLGEKMLATRGLLANLAAMGLTIPPEYQLSLTALLSKVREIYRAWANAEIEQVSKLLRELFLADPSLVCLQALDDEIKKTSAWVNDLKEGPHSEQTVNDFGAQLLEVLPKAHLHLGTPDWLNTMVGACQSFQKCQDLDQMRTLLKQAGLPLNWADYTSLSLEFIAPPKPLKKFTQAQEDALQAYYLALSTNKNAVHELEQIRAVLPGYHFLYARLRNAFQQAWNLQPAKSEELCPIEFPPADLTRVKEAMSVLDYIKTWRHQTQTRSLGSFVVLPKIRLNWVQLAEIQNVRKDWQETILPALGKMKQKEWDLPANVEPRQSAYPDLITVLRGITRLSYAWRKIETQGIYKENLADMTAFITEAQAKFYAFWQSLNHSPINANRWLAMVYQPNFSEINQTFLLIMRHLQSVARALDVVNTPQMARTRLALNSAGELMFALVQLNDLIMPPSRDLNLYRHWRQQYLDLLQEGQLDRIRENIQSIESIHPLLPWFDELLQRDTEYFKIPDKQRW